MDNSITIHKNPQFGDVRIIDRDGEPWFVLADLCSALGITRSASAVLQRLDDGVRQTYPIVDALGRPQLATIVSEPGMYEVVIRSDKPEAAAFRRWITTEVLPSIRKHGAYMTPETLEKALLTPDFLILLATEMKAEQTKRIAAEAKVAELAPKAEFYDAIADSRDAIEIGELAKVLAIPNLGPNNLFRRLRELRILMRDNSPYQDYIDRGIFRVIERVWTDPEGGAHPYFKTLVLPRGQEYIRKVVSAS